MHNILPAEPILLSCVFIFFMWDALFFTISTPVADEMDSVCELVVTLLGLPLTVGNKQ